MELRRRARQIMPQVIAACMAGYFLFHFVQGERGLISYLERTRDLHKIEKIRDQVKDRKLELQKKVSLLRPDSLDLDMLEERTRIVLHYTRENERVIYEK